MTMIRPLITLLVALFWASPAMLAKAPVLKITATSQTPTVKDHGIYRFAVCPNGSSIIVHSDGDLAVVSRSGESLLNREDWKEIAGASACTCDQTNRLYVAAMGMVHVYELTAGNGIRRLQSILTQGGPLRMLVTPDNQLYIVGLAKVGGRYVFLRRFSLPGGAYLGSPDIRLPLLLGTGFNLNQMVLNGSIVWLPLQREVAFIAANPLELWRLDSAGRVLQVTRPQTSGFFNTEVQPRTGGSSHWDGYDWVRSAVALPDGRVLLQVRLARQSKPLPGVGHLHAELLDPSLDSVQQYIPTDQIPPGWLAGGDAEGNIYFIDLLASRRGVIVQTRLTSE